MAVTVSWYDSFAVNKSNGAIDLDSDTFKVALMTSSHAFNAAHSAWADVSANEIAAGNGYTAGGQALTSVTFTQTAGVATFDADNPEWIASGGAMATSSSAVVYSATGGELVCSIDFGEDKTPEDGAKLKITIADSGLFYETPPGG